MTINDLIYVKLNSVNSLYFIVNNVSGYSEEVNGNKYLTPVPANESKIKKYEELCSKIRDLIR